MHGIKSTKLNTLPSMLQAVIIRLIKLLKKGLFFKANPFFCRPIKSMFGEKSGKGRKNILWINFTNLPTFFWSIDACPLPLCQPQQLRINTKKSTCWQVVTVVTGAARNIVAITGVTWLNFWKMAFENRFLPQTFGLLYWCLSPN